MKQYSYIAYGIIASVCFSSSVYAQVSPNVLELIKKQNARQQSIVNDINKKMSALPVNKSVQSIESGNTTISDTASTSIPVGNINILGNIDIINITGWDPCFNFTDAPGPIYNISATSGPININTSGSIPGTATSGPININTSGWIPGTATSGPININPASPIPGNVTAYFGTCMWWPEKPGNVQLSNNTYDSLSLELQDAIVMLQAVKTSIAATQQILNDLEKAAEIYTGPTLPQATRAMAAATIDMYRKNMIQAQTAHLIADDKTVSGGDIEISFHKESRLDNHAALVIKLNPFNFDSLGLSKLDFSTVEASRSSVYMIQKAKDALAISNVQAEKIDDAIAMIGSISQTLILDHKILAKALDLVGSTAIEANGKPRWFYNGELPNAKFSLLVDELNKVQSYSSLNGLIQMGAGDLHIVIGNHYVTATISTNGQVQPVVDNFNELTVRLPVTDATLLFPDQSPLKTVEALPTVYKTIKSAIKNMVYNH